VRTGSTWTNYRKSRGTTHGACEGLPPRGPGRLLGLQRPELPVGVSQRPQARGPDPEPYNRFPRRLVPLYPRRDGNDLGTEMALRRNLNGSYAGRPMRMAYVQDTHAFA